MLPDSAGRLPNGSSADYGSITGTPITFPATITSTSPISSGHASPTLRTGGGTASPNGPSRHSSGSEIGGGALFQGSTLSAISALRQPDSAKSRSPGTSRSISIVEDLQSRGTGPVASAMPKKVSTDGTFGNNPFENVHLPASPAYLTASPQGLQTPVRKPSAIKLVSEGAGPASISSFSTALRERLDLSGSDGNLSSLFGSGSRTGRPHASGVSMPSRILMSDQELTGNL